jgi:hypothetical protein
MMSAEETLPRYGHSPMTAAEHSHTQDDHSRSCTIAAFINPPADDQLTCEEANTYAATAVSLDYTNNGTAGCLIQGSVVGVITSNYDECGGDYHPVWTFTDDCAKNDYVYADDHGRSCTNCSFH